MTSQPREPDPLLVPPGHPAASTEADPLTSHSDHSRAPSGMNLHPPRPPHRQHRHSSMETNEISVASLLCDYRL